MSDFKVFISYSSGDITFMEYLKVSIDKHKPLKALVVPQEKSPLSYNAEKVKQSLDDAKIFIPILTANSINNQWVNQEIGYAFKKFNIQNFYPLVQNSIKSKLKGFISDNNDLNYRFEENEFKIKFDELVNDLYEKYKNKGKYDIR